MARASHWSKIEGHSSSAASYEKLEALLATEVNTQSAERIEFTRIPGTSFVLSRIGEHPDEQRWIEPSSGRIEPRRSNLRHALNELHFLGQLPAGTQLTGLFSVALMVLSLGGLLILIKDIPKELWTFRPEKKTKI